MEIRGIILVTLHTWRGSIVQQTFMITRAETIRASQNLVGFTIWVVTADRDHALVNETLRGFKKLEAV